jgi:arsenate reductase (glutaredoxin)
MTRTAVLYHNPACGTSRKVLAALTEAGVDVEVIEYLKAPPDRATLERLLKKMGKSVREILRRKGTPFDQLRLGDPKVTEAEVFAAIAAHPILIERPIVDMGEKAALCRPAETVQDLLC